MNTLRRFQLLGLCLIAVVWLNPLSPSALAQNSSGSAMVLTLEGPLTPAMKLYLERGLGWAKERNAPLVVVRLNTPGGTLTLMEEMISLIRNSETPVVVYVSPRGAIAGSAGTLITLAGHVAAMAPETAIGAASPVGGEGEDLGETMEAKLKEAMKALARTLAERRGARAVRLAEQTIEDAKAVTAREALDAGLVDIIANDLTDLFSQLDERTVNINGVERTLLTRGLLVETVEMGWVEMALSLLANSTLVALLLSIGVTAIVIEFWTPGTWGPGLVGVVCLIVAFFGLGMLPVNWFGIAFIVLGAILLVAELVNPATFGLLITLGITSFVVGILILFNSPGSLPYFQINVPLLLLVAALMLIFSLAFVWYAVRSIRHRPLMVAGTESLVGQSGDVRADNSAYVGGELWTIESESPLSIGDKIIVTAAKGLKLLVRKKE